MNYEQALQECVLGDDRFIVMTAENRAAIRDLPSIIGSRFVDTGITEQTLIGMAAGFALRGRIPIVHALAAFLTMRAFEFVRTDIGLGGLPVKLVGSVPGFLSEANGPTHQAVEDVSLMRGIPQMQLFCPADEQDLVIGLPEVLASRNPVYIRHSSLASSVDHDPNFVIGKAEKFGRGTEVVILVYGTLFTQAHEAMVRLQAMGVSTSLLNLRMIKPIDREAILEAAGAARLLVTVEDHFLTGGLFSLVSQLLVRHQLMVPVLPLALHNRWFQPAMLDDILNYESFTGQQITRRIIRQLNSIYKGGNGNAQQRVIQHPIS